jgi:hypothetical protein
MKKGEEIKIMLLNVKRSILTMYNPSPSPDDFDELESMDEELLEAFDAINTAASESSHPSPTVSQCSVPTAPNSSGKS